MQLPETLPGLANELRALPARQRQAILGSLSPAERSRMMTLLNRPGSQPEPAESAPAPAPEPATDGLSPWLADRVRHVQPGADPGPWRMTAATRSLLAKSSAGSTLKAVATKPLVAPVPGGRSLLGTVGDMLAPRRARA